MKQILRLYFVAGTQDCRHLPAGSPEEKLLGTLEAALRGGVSVFQFREKGTFALKDEARIKRLAAACMELCRSHGVPFVMNNDVRAALAMGADGVHIGQKDMPISEAAELCRGKLFVGISNHGLGDILRNPHAEKADYFAVGPIFPTTSKEDAAAPVGVEAVREIRAAGVQKPLVAIGGITTASASEIRAAGADGVAVVAAIAGAKEVEAAARRLA